MTNICKANEEILMDIYYREVQWSPDLREHLKNCQKCSRFWEELQEMKDVFNEVNDPSIDYPTILNVMKRAEEIETKRVNLRELVVFVLLAGTFLGGMASLMIGGYGKQVIYLQGILHVGLPLTLPLILWKRKLKEGYDV